jgi:hypothetical protein
MVSLVRSSVAARAEDVLICRGSGDHGGNHAVLRLLKRSAMSRLAELKVYMRLA